MSTISSSIVRSGAYNQIKIESFGSIFEPIQKFPDEFVGEFDRYKAIPYGASEEDSYLTYLILINSEAFYKTDRGFLAIFHYSEEQDYVVNFFDLEAEIIGDNESNWASQILPNARYKNDIERFLEKCESAFGIPRVKFDPYLDIDLDIAKWNPIKK